VAWSSPAAIATSLPKLRLKEIAPTRRSSRWRAAMAAIVPSWLPSSMNRISQSEEMRSRTGTSRSQTGPMPEASLKTGITTLISVVDAGTP
jgi:hypothetical protein